MSDVKTLKSVVEMGYQSLPNQGEDSVNEYLGHLAAKDENEHSALVSKLTNFSYRENFTKANLATSILILMSAEDAGKQTQTSTTGENDELLSFQDEYLLMSSKDDELTRNMRLFYFGNMDADTIGITSMSDDANTQTRLSQTYNKSIGRMFSRLSKEPIY